MVLCHHEAGMVENEILRLSRQGGSGWREGKKNNIYWTSAICWTWLGSFPCIVSVNPHNYCVRQELLSPFHRWENWGPGILNKSSEYKYFWLSSPLSLLLRTKVMVHRLSWGTGNNRLAPAIHSRFSLNSQVASVLFMLVFPTGLQGACQRRPHLFCSAMYS